MLHDLTSLRRDLHAHPELSGDEEVTAQRVVRALEPLAPDRLLTGLGGTGVLASFDSGRDGPGVLLRAELDALPITEIGVEGHGSAVDGVSHKCGHDGHMAMLVGAAQRLAAQRPQRGSVHLLFQPAEETGSGAAAVLADPAFADIRPDVGFAIHNMPGHPLHTVVLKQGWLTPAVRSLAITLHGRTSHASEPHLGDNPSSAVADLLRACDEFVIAERTAPDFRLVTPVHVRIGTVAYGVSAGDAEVHLTLRASDNAVLDALHEHIEELTHELARRDRLRSDVHVVEDFRANWNDPAVAEEVGAVARDAGLDLVEPDAGMAAGEDFGLFTERFPCCMVLLGAGEDHDPLHSEAYDFPDALIGTGVDLLDAVARRFTT